MNDRHRAIFYEGHKEDIFLWGKGERSPRRESRDLSANVSVRFAAPLAGCLRAYAKEHGMTYSEVVRAAVETYVSATKEN